jgi:hypothetical protein
MAMIGFITFLILSPLLLTKDFKKHHFFFIDLCVELNKKTELFFRGML